MNTTEKPMDITTTTTTTTEKPMDIAATEKPMDATIANEPADATAPAPVRRRKKGHSILDAAMSVLSEAGRPMSCKDISNEIAARGLWETTGKTPERSLYSALHRDIQKSESRFVKTGPGIFARRDQ